MGEVAEQTVPRLDGVWDVDRVGGALPPLYGVRKRIAGDRGVTVAGRLPAMRFEVDGLRLRYRAPFVGLVDDLTPEEDGFAGRATLFGRELGQFRMRRVPGEAEAVEDALRGQVARLLDEALAMEQAILRLLDSAVQTTTDEKLREAFRRHRRETEAHADRIRARLEAYGRSPSLVRQLGGTLEGLAGGLLTATRTERGARNARDGYAVEHFEVAAYELLERVASRAGDDETAALAREIRGEEEAMASRLADLWDRVAELALRDAGVPPA